MVCQVIERTNAVTINRFVDKAISPKVSLIATDSDSAFNDLPFMGRHKTVNHKAEEYVRGVVHTQNIDSFWSLLKRGIVGNFHQVSKTYLPLYLNEFTFRHNNRANPDIFGAVVAGC